MQYGDLFGATTREFLIETAKRVTLTRGGLVLQLPGHPTEDETPQQMHRFCRFAVAEAGIHKDFQGALRMIEGRGGTWCTDIHVRDVPGATEQYPPPGPGVVQQPLVPR